MCENTLTAFSRKTNPPEKEETFPYEAASEK